MLVVVVVKLSSLKGCEGNMELLYDNALPTGHPLNIKTAGRSPKLTKITL